MSGCNAAVSSRCYAGRSSGVQEEAELALEALVADDHGLEREAQLLGRPPRPRRSSASGRWASQTTRR